MAERSRDADAASAARQRAEEVVASFDGPAGADLHVPFCPQICSFCPYDKVLADAALGGRYFRALTKEVVHYLAAAERAGWGPFGSLHIGGGTPTLYPEALAALIARLPVSGEIAGEVLRTTAPPSASTSSWRWG